MAKAREWTSRNGGTVTVEHCTIYGTKRETVETVREVLPDESGIIPSFSEAEKLREAIRDAGFSVMQTSGRWSIHDVSELAKAEQAKTDEVIRQNIDLEIKVKQLESAVKEAFDLFRTADNERLNEVYEADAEAEKWKAEGDMYGWNFHKGKAGGMTQASIIFYRVFRRLKAALK